MMKSVIVSILIAALSRAVPVYQPLDQQPGDNPTLLGHSPGIGVELTTQTIAPQFSLLQIFRTDGVSVDHEGNLIHYPKKYANMPMTCDGIATAGTIWQERSEVTNVYAEFKDMAYKIGFSANASEPFTLTRYDRMVVMPEQLEKIQNALNKASESINSSAPAPATTEQEVCEVRLDENWATLVNKVGCAFANNEVDTYRKSD
ncbi:hypothetical protein MIR68_005278 [Amoeboaphelidium protococcarum]|nr:hypothetical protein MIR68_005278 [Amoeboaphelidium protococcarum]